MRSSAFKIKMTETKFAYQNSLEHKFSSLITTVLFSDNKKSFQCGEDSEASAKAGEVNNQTAAEVMAAVVETFQIAEATGTF